MVRRTRAPGAFEEALTRRVGALRALLLAGALAAVIVLAALAAAIVWRQYEVGKREAVSELRARAVLAATVFDTYFAGQLEALSAIAASPSVRAGDTEAMRRYFAAFRPRSGRAFTAGVGWIDLGGRQRATSDPRGPIRPSLADRSYFERVVETKAPFVSEAIVARQTRRRILVMAVPTRDAGGRFSGVLAGGLVLQTSTDDARATDLGFAGLRVIDRTGQQVTLRNLARPVNTELVAELRRRKEGFVVGTRGLDGSTDRVIAFASATIPGWTAVLDQPTGVVFAGPRRGLLLEAALIGIASVFLLLLIGWAWRRARAEERAGRAQVRRWAQLTHDLNQAESGSQVRESSPPPSRPSSPKPPCS